jgi:hypothetical protein
MLMSEFFVRDLDPEMGTAVANRTYLRREESWGDLAKRVALGNSLLDPSGENDRLDLEKAICNASFLTAGRHLQHGDADQPNRNIEVFTNCSTACTSFMEFLLLLNGSGVGRNYSDEFMVTDWRNMPHLYCVLSADHPDFERQYFKDYTPKVSVTALEDTGAYPQNPDLFYEVEDSREGWAKALEVLEVAAFEKHPHDHYVFDFSKIRKYGSPIKGMQNRPASGPLPLIYAFKQVAKVKYEQGMMPWMQAIIIDHEASAAVANGGARRSARIAVKYWKDKEIMKFIHLKRDRPELWSSNNSVGVENSFWKEAKILGSVANNLYLEITKSVFQDLTGEPGLIALDQLTIK